MRWWALVTTHFPSKMLGVPVMSRMAPAWMLGFPSASPSASAKVDPMCSASASASAVASAWDTSGRSTMT